MSVEEIFADIIAHSTEGMMFHDQLAEYFEFIGLSGFASEQQMRLSEETAEHMRITRYFIDHYNTLPQEQELKNPAVIPSGWYGYKRQDVDSATRRNGVAEGFSRWIEWEKSTKELYEEKAKSLLDMGAVAGAIVVGKLASDVNDELATAEQEKLELEAMNYDLAGIIELQSKSDLASKAPRSTEEASYDFT